MRVAFKCIRYRFYKAKTKIKKGLMLHIKALSTNPKNLNWQYCTTLQLHIWFAVTRFLHLYYNCKSGIDYIKN